MRLPFDQIAEGWNQLDHQVLVRHRPLVPLWYGGVSMAHGSRIRGHGGRQPARHADLGADLGVDGLLSRADRAVVTGS